MDDKTSQKPDTGVSMPREIEREQAQDIAYTINHALACTATDLIDPYVGNLTQTYLGKRFSVGCAHDHGAQDHDGHVHEHSHDHAHSAGPHAESHDRLGHWWVGEAVGDFGAVPLTVAAQRYFPGVMNGMRAAMEPLLGGFFHAGAERSSARWARQHGIRTDSQDYRDHVEVVYRHEIDHLPQALMWTASSVVLNLCTQKALGNDGPLWHMAAGKTVGAGISAGLVVGGRGIAPDAAEQWDTFTGERIFLPATKMLGRIFGVNEEDVERMKEKQKRLDGAPWSQRIASDSEQRGR